MNKLEEILRKIVKTGIFVLPFLPFFVFNSLFFPFITGKGFIFRIVVEIILGAWIGLMFLNKKYRPKFSWLLGSIGLFTLITFLADIFGVSPFKSLWSNYERMEGFVTIAHLFAYFLVASSVLSTEKIWKRFFQTSLGVSVLVSFIGLFQLGGLVTTNQSSVRLDAYIGNSTYLAVYMLIHIFLAIFFFVRRTEKNWWSWAYIGVAVLDTLILYYSATRGAILGLIFGALLSCLLIAIFAKENPKVRKISAGIILGIVVLVGLFVSMRNVSWVQENQVLGRFASISLEESTTKSRFLVWNIAWQGFKERPILGWGQENFNYVFNKYYDPQMFNQEQWFDRTHNIVFDWLIAGGALGLLSYLLMFGLSLYYVWKKREHFGILGTSVMIGLLGAYFFQNLFVFDNILSYLLFFSILGYLQTLNNDTDIVQDEALVVSNDTQKFFVGRTVVGISLVVTVFLIYGVNYKAYAANRNMIEAFIDMQVAQNKPRDMDSAIAHFKKALAYHSLGQIEVREQVAQIGSSVQSWDSADASNEIKQEFRQLGKQSLEDQIKDTPQDARHYVFLGSFLNSIGDFDGAIDILEKGLELSPKKQIIMTEIGTSYLNKGEYSKALEWFKKAYDLSPSFGPLRQAYGIAALYAKDFKLATDLFSVFPEEQLVNDNRLLVAYKNIGQFSKVIEILEKRVELKPQVLDNYISLAAGYMQAERRNNAVTILEKAVSLFPDFKGQGEYYISEIKAGRNP